MANKLNEDQLDKLAHYAEQINRGSWQNNTEFIRDYNELTGETETFQGFNLSADSRLKKGLLALAAKHKVVDDVHKLTSYNSKEAQQHLAVLNDESLKPIVLNEEPFVQGQPERFVVLDEEQPQDKPKPVQTKKK